MKEEKLLEKLAEWKRRVRRNEAPNNIIWHIDDDSAYKEIVALIENVELPEFLQGVALKQREVDSLKKHIKNIEKRCTELIDKNKMTVARTRYWADILSKNPGDFQFFIGEIVKEAGGEVIEGK